MKKFILALGAFCMLSVFAGCSNLKEEKIPKLEANIESDVKIFSEDLQYDCKFFFSPQGIANINFKSPESLSGFTISKEAGNFKLIQGNLEAQYTKTPFINSNCVEILIDILDNLNTEERNFTLKNEEEGEKIYKGMVKDNECNVVLNKKGKIIKICVPNKAIEADFNV